MRRASVCGIVMLATACGPAAPPPAEPERFALVAATTAPMPAAGDQIFEVEAPGWDWVYEGIAHGQTFVTGGTAIATLRLRVAKLNDNTPEAPLTVEVRDESLATVHAKGTITSDRATREFRWLGVDLAPLRPLVPGNTYALVFHSARTTNAAPWVVNETYDDVYPHGRDLAEDDDFFFDIVFDTSRRLRVGPADGVVTVPINSGETGGAHVPLPLTTARGLLPTVELAR